MNESILKLAPKGVWEEFKGILNVPRPSKKEEKMVAYLEKWAKDHKIEYIKEKCGNIIMNAVQHPVLRIQYTHIENRSKR